MRPEEFVQFSRTGLLMPFGDPRTQRGGMDCMEWLRPFSLTHPIWKFFSLSSGAEIKRLKGLSHSGTRRTAHFKLKSVKESSPLAHITSKLALCQLCSKGQWPKLRPRKLNGSTDSDFKGCLFSFQGQQQPFPQVVTQCMDGGRCPSLTGGFCHQKALIEYLVAKGDFNYVLQREKT